MFLSTESSQHAYELLWLFSSLSAGAVNPESRDPYNFQFYCQVSLTWNVEVGSFFQRFNDLYFNILFCIGFGLKAGSLRICVGKNWINKRTSLLVIICESVHPFVNIVFPWVRFKLLLSKLMIFKYNNLLANIISYFILSEPKFEYDAFVIYSSYDSDWVIKTLIPILERKHSFKCCVQYRDFVVGVPFRENMVNSV